MRTLRHTHGDDLAHTLYSFFTGHHDVYSSGNISKISSVRLLLHAGIRSSACRVVAGDHLAGWSSLTRLRLHIMN